MNDELEDLRQRIRQLRDDDDSLLIADLHGRLGAALAQTAKVAWTEELIQEVLQAYGTALHHYAAADDLPNYLQTLRNIGAAYFNTVLSGLGNVTELTSAAQAYEDVLWTAPPSFDPQLRESWQRELDAIREVAIEMWEGVLPQFDRERQPWEWSYAHLCLGGLYRMRRPGDADENLERSIASLDQALEVLSFETTFDPWLHAHYHRGQAYLFRREGEKTENLAQALESLQITVEHGYLTPENDPRKWTMVMTQIAQVLVLRNATDAAREHAEKALTADQSLWAADSWATAQLLLAGLRLGMTADENTLAHTPPEPWAHDAINDPFDMTGRLEQQVAALAEKKEVTIDEEWHVPTMVTESVTVLCRHFDKSVGSTSLWLRNPDERQALELARLQIYQLMFGEIRVWRESAARTRALFERVARGEEAFALLLRDFRLRTQWFRGGVSVSQGPLGGDSFPSMVLRIAPVATVCITNPADAAPLGGDEGYRVESGSSWQSDARRLIAAASFIVVDNRAMTEGVRYEIAALHEMRRLDDTLFADAEAAAKFLGMPVREFSKEQLERMRERAMPQPIDPEALPPAACRWIEGAQRDAYEQKLRALLPWVDTLPEPGSAVAADLTLDALAYVISAAVLLQNEEVLPPLFARVTRTLKSYPEDYLREAQQLALACAELIDVR